MRLQIIQTPSKEQLFTALGASSSEKQHVLQLELSTITPEERAQIQKYFGLEKPPRILNFKPTVLQRQDESGNSFNVNGKVNERLIWAYFNTFYRIGTLTFDI